MKLIKLTDLDDGSDIYINPELVRAVHIQDEKTLVCSGTMTIPVKESIEDTVKKIEGAM